jgi:hypothetical protein
MLIRLHNQQCRAALKFNCTPKSLASKHIRRDPQAVLNSICTPESLQNKRIWLDAHKNMAAPPLLDQQKNHGSIEG